jgi:membrane protease subunit HflC
LKIKLKTTIIVVVLLALIILALNSVFTVQENEFACIVRFSKIIDTHTEAGLYFKMPFLDSVKYFQKAIMLYDIPPSEVFTSDKQNMTVDSYVLWKIDNPKLVYQTLGNRTVAEERLDAITYNALKNVMGTLTQADIINEDDASERNDIYAGIATSVGALAENYGINVVDVKIKRFDLPESNENAVYERMISERRQMAAAYTANGEYEASLIRNEVDKQVNIIVSNAKATAAQLEAEGESEYMRMLAEAYDNDDKKEFYTFMKSLFAAEEAMSGEDKTVILGSGSSLADILSGID